MLIYLGGEGVEAGVGGIGVDPGVSGEREQKACGRACPLGDADDSARARAIECCRVYRCRVGVF